MKWRAVTVVVGYSALYENDVAVMIRVKYPAGARSVMHSHPAGCAIFYKDATLKMTSSTGGFGHTNIARATCRAAMPTATLPRTSGGIPSSFSFI